MSELRSASNPMGPWKVAADFHVPEGFSDSSWDQDVNPSVICDATGCTIYWDTEDNVNMKAEGVEGAERFFVLHPDDGHDLYCGSDLQEAIRTAKLACPSEINSKS